MDWQAKARQKREDISKSIPSQWKIDASQVPPPSVLRDFTPFITQFLSAQEVFITNLSAEKLLGSIRSRQYTSVEVTRAFCHRAAVAHQLVNCLSETCFQAAEERAKALDAHLFRTGQTLGPFHGLPVSLTDRFHVGGLDSACGYVSWIGNRKGRDDEGLLVRTLRQMGAVVFVKTNVPQSMLMGETTNNVIGSTINPYNRFLSAGGASGGEGALCALRGSPLGMGSDIAGSIRIPCAFNNLYGLRSSFGRLPASGLTTSLTGLPVVGSVVGPMASDLSTLTLSVRALLESCPWRSDCDVVDMPWRETRYQENRSRAARPGERDGKLIFAVFKYDGNVRPHPPVQRALELVTKALLQQGYEVIEWDPPSHFEAAQILFQILGATAANEVRQALDASGEPPVHQLRGWYDDQNVEPCSSAEFWTLCQQRDDFRQKYNKYWMSTQEKTVPKRAVDGVVMPIAPSACAEEGKFNYYAYSGLVNLLDYTSASFPVTFADSELDPEMPDYVPTNAADQETWYTYSKELFDGAPVGLQMMGRRFEEEKVLALVEAVSAALREYQPGRGT